MGSLALVEWREKMIKTILICGLLLSAPLATMGLKCYVTNAQSGADLTDCASGEVCAIIKIDATGQKLQACKGDEGELGCKASTTSVAGTACLCDSDGTGSAASREASGRCSRAQACPGDRKQTEGSSASGDPRP